MESSSESHSDSHEHGNRKPLTVCVTNIMGAEYHPAMTPSPQRAGEEPACFCKLDLLRKCFVGGEGEASKQNMLQTPTGRPLTTPPKSETPLHEEIIAGDENSTPPPSTVSPVIKKNECSSPSSTSSNYAVRRSPPTVSPTVLAFQGLNKSSEHRWEELEDDLLILLNGRLDHLADFQKLHTDGIQNSCLLQSIAYLSTFRKGQSETDESKYYEHISVLAAYLSVGRAKRERKLVVIKTLVTCLSPAEASWQVQDAVIEGTLDFITCRSNEEWEFMEHTETMLIWELRAMSLRLLDREQERVAIVAKTGDTAAIVISAGARLVQEGMTRSGASLSNKIEHAGVHVKGHLKANDYPLMMDRDAVVALAFADAAKRASMGAKQSTKLAMDGIRDASGRGIQMVASKFEDGKMTENLPPEGREALKAAGKVGLATVGAAAMVGEALVETSRLVMENTGKVASGVVEHKYGTSAGKVARDANETATNIMRAIGDVARFSETGTLAKVVAVGEAKGHAMLEAEKAKEALKRFESQATSLFKNVIENGSRWMGPGQLASSSRPSLPVSAEHSMIPTKPKSGAAKRLFMDETKACSSTPDLAPSSSVDSESSSGSSLRRTFSSDEDNSSEISKANQSSCSTTSVTIASRRNSSLRRSMKDPITPNSYGVPRRKSHLRSTGSKRRGTGKRVPLTPNMT
jgi:hypothetical protein